MRFHIDAITCAYTESHYFRHGFVRPVTGKSALCIVNLNQEIIGRGDIGARTHYILGVGNLDAKRIERQFTLIACRWIPGFVAGYGTECQCKRRKICY